MELSIQNILSQATHSIRNNFGFFIAITLLFFVLSAVIEFTYLYTESDSRLIRFLFILVGFALYVKQAVVIHRSVILAEGNRWDKVFSWGSPDNQFLIICIGLWLVFSLFIGLLGAFVFPLLMQNDPTHNIELNLYYFVLPVLLIAGLIFSRICLVLPSRAVGEKMSIGDSIALTKANGLKMIVLIVLFPIATNLLVSELMSEDILIYNLIITLVAHLVVVFQVSVLSHTFMTLTNNKTPEVPVQMDV